jgi:hypothetical protein
MSRLTDIMGHTMLAGAVSQSVDFHMLAINQVECSVGNLN